MFYQWVGDYKTVTSPAIFCTCFLLSFVNPVIKFYCLVGINKF